MPKLVFGASHAQVIEKTYIVTFKDKTGNHTGDTKNDTERETLTRAKGKNYTINSLPVKKGKCGVIYKSISKEGITKMYLKLVDTRELADKACNEKNNASYGNYSCLEIICN